MLKTFQFRLNGRPTEISVDPERRLLWVLRTDLGLTGAKYGCGEGYCGACTVLVDNVAVRSCLVPVGDVAGTEVLTIEGLARNDELHPLQQAFVDHDALQCGYCTPGMILGAYSFLMKNPNASRNEIVAHMDDHLCRCGSHVRVLAAIETASRSMKGGRL
jgi:aerobic-type carbon monoxide dehydrogenase small subunit (CoxS/CutS family)